MLQMLVSGGESRVRRRWLDLCFGAVLVLIAGSSAIFSTVLSSLPDPWMCVAIVMAVYLPYIGLGVYLLHRGLERGSVRLTAALLLAIATFATTVVAIGHGWAPSVVFLLPGNFPGETALAWAGIILLFVGRSRFPSPSGRLLLTGGVLVLGLACARIVHITESSGLTVPTALPFCGVGLWLLVEAWRGRSSEV